MCRFVRALYGHPESGAHWDNHLHQSVLNIGGSAVVNHPSSYLFKTEKLLLTVYVDDLLLSGPSDAHDKLWERLGAKIDIDPPEPLARFLGRAHIEL